MDNGVFELMTNGEYVLYGAMVMPKKYKLLTIIKENYYDKKKY
jgi:hypothetical protein